MFLRIDSNILHFNTPVNTIINSVQSFSLETRLNHVTTSRRLSCESISRGRQGNPIKTSGTRKSIAGGYYPNYASIRGLIVSWSLSGSCIAKRSRSQRSARSFLA